MNEEKNTMPDLSGMSLEAILAFAAEAAKALTAAKQAAETAKQAVLAGAGVFLDRLSAIDAELKSVHDGPAGNKVKALKADLNTAQTELDNALKAVNAEQRREAVFSDALSQGVNLRIALDGTRTMTPVSDGRGRKGRARMELNGVHTLNGVTVTVVDGLPQIDGKATSYAAACRMAGIDTGADSPVRVFAKAINVTLND